MIHTLNNMYGHAWIGRFFPRLHAHRINSLNTMIFHDNSAKIAIMAQDAYNAFPACNIAIQ